MLAGDLEPSFSERDLGTSLVRDKTTCAVEPILLQGAKVARDAVTTFLAGDEPSSENINKMLANRLPHLLTVDSFIKIGQKFFDASTGKSGMNRVHDLVLELVPAVEANNRSSDSEGFQKTLQ